MNRWLRETVALHLEVAVVVFIGLFFMFDWRLAIVLGVVSAVFYVVAIVAGFLGLFS